jgi:hypothetical protein
MIQFGSLNSEYGAHAARILAEAAATQGQKAFSLISKDLSWLWRTAYNCAFQGCCEWDSTTEQSTELFNIAREVKRSFYPTKNPIFDMNPSYWKFPVRHQLSAPMPSHGSTLRTHPLLLCLVKVRHCFIVRCHFRPESIRSVFCKIVHDSQFD